MPHLRALRNRDHRPISIIRIVLSNIQDQERHYNPDHSAQEEVEIGPWDALHPQEMATDEVESYRSDYDRDVIASLHDCNRIFAVRNVLRDSFFCSDEKSCDA